jgi:two-component system, NtrC family, sensor histidine kinase HydH
MQRNQPAQGHDLRKDTDGEMRDGPHHLRMVVLSVAASLAAILITTTLLTGGLARYTVEQMILREARLTADFLNSIVRVEEAENYFAGNGNAPGDVKEFVAHLGRMPDVFRANVYSQQGRILWSTDKSLFGRSFPNNEELAAALRGELHPELSLMAGNDKSEHDGVDKEMPAPSTEFIEYYIPIQNRDGTAIVGAVEIYKSSAGLSATLGHVRMMAWLGALAATAILFTALLVIVIYSGRILRRQEARLIEAERLAVVGDMASAVAHGLRNPLAAIRSCAELTVEDDIPAASRQSIQAIIDQVDRLEGWIRSFLVRNEHERATIEIGARLDLVAGRALDNFAPQMARRGIALRRSGSSALSVAAGSAEVEQVLNTLLSNAVEAMRDGGTLEVGCTANARNSAEVTIRDTGPGLSFEAEVALFTAFRTTKASGLGVGLALGRRIAERLGGQLDIRNRADGISGVEARLILPLRR